MMDPEHPQPSAHRPPFRATRIGTFGLVICLVLMGMGAQEVAAGTSVITLFLVEDRAYLSGEELTVNVHLLRSGKGLEPDEHPELKVNPDQFANDQRESRNVSLTRVDKGHYQATLTIQEADFDDFGNMFLRVPFEYKGELKKSDQYLDVDVGYLPFQGHLVTSRAEALPGESVFVNFSLVDRTDNYRSVPIDELELTYQLPGENERQTLYYEKEQGLASALLELPQVLDHGGALVIRAQGSSGDEDILEYATVWIPLIRIWVEQLEVSSDQILWNVWVADSTGKPLSGVEVDLALTQRDENDREVALDGLVGSSDSSGEVNFQLGRAEGAQRLFIEGQSEFQGLSRDFTHFWNLAFTEPVRLSPLVDDLLNNSFEVGSPLILNFELHQGERLLPDREVSLLVISEQGLVEGRPWITDERGQIGVEVTLPERPGPLEVAVEDVKTGGWTSWSTWVHDPGLDLTVPKLNLTRPSALFLSTTRIMRFPSFEMAVTDVENQGWLPVRDPHGDAALPYHFTFEPVERTDDRYRLDLQLPAFLPGNAIVDLEIKGENIAKGRTVSNSWVLRPGMTTEREHFTVVPSKSGGDSDDLAWYLVLLALVLTLGGALSLYLVYLKRQSGTREEPQEDLWDEALEQPPLPQLPTQPYYGASEAVMPQLLTVACPFCQQPMGVPFEGQPVLVNCPHCSQQCRVG